MVIYCQYQVFVHNYRYTFVWQWNRFVFTVTHQLEHMSKVALRWHGGDNIIQWEIFSSIITLKKHCCILKIIFYFTSMSLQFTQFTAILGSGNMHILQFTVTLGSGNMHILQFYFVWNTLFLPPPNPPPLVSLTSSSYLRILFFFWSHVMAYSVCTNEDN